MKRCNSVRADFRMEFHEKKESKYRKNADLKMQNEVENVIRLSSFGAKRHSEGEYLESEEAGASEVPWETGETAAKPAKKAAPAKKTEASAAKKEAVPAGKKSAKQEEHGGSERILAAAGISGRGVLLNVLTIRM